jgi:hypothetical protein
VTEIYAGAIESALGDMDIEPRQFRYDYSGRFMYGKSCLGLTGQLRDLAEFLLYVVPETGVDAEWQDVKMDSMGMDMIFYWPSIRVIVPTDEELDRTKTS